MNKSARCAPRLNAREAAENAEMLLIAAEQCAEILGDLPKTKAMRGSARTATELAAKRPTATSRKDLRKP